MDTTAMGTLVISIYKSYGVVLFEGAVQLKLFPETNLSNGTTVRHNSSKYGTNYVPSFMQTFCLAALLTMPSQLSSSTNHAITTYQLY